ncbi:hypothetical protein HAX54_050586 [Datura stramonium]|uniref:Uncharacterized protein n=1 Tax=Datura stramonium TaxID=4076 RepID=A0ABS8WLK3_DATST|nr:hypothetical protein [Datura stramonium]
MTRLAQGLDVNPIKKHHQVGPNPLLDAYSMMARLSSASTMGLRRGPTLGKLESPTPPVAAPCRGVRKPTTTELAPPETPRHPAGEEAERRLSEGGDNQVPHLVNCKFLNNIGTRISGHRSPENPRIPATPRMFS